MSNLKEKIEAFHTRLEGHFQQKSVGPVGGVANHVFKIEMDNNRGFVHLVKVSREFVKDSDIGTIIQCCDRAAELLKAQTFSVVVQINWPRDVRLVDR